MGRRRGYLPPASCEECGKSPLMGQPLWPGERWRCLSCLEKTLPGKDAISKSMHQSCEYARTMGEVFSQEAEEGKTAEGLRNEAEWARQIAVEIRKQGMVCAKT